MILKTIFQILFMLIAFFGFMLQESDDTSTNIFGIICMIVGISLFIGISV